MNRKLVTQIPLFAGIRRRERRAVASLADEVIVPAGARLTSEGGRAAEFFVVLAGSAEVSSGARPLGELRPGDFFGEIGLLRGRVRTATVTASSPMRLLVVAPREFRSLLELPVVAARIRAAASSRALRVAG